MSTIKCPKCGTELQDNEKFCHNCGNVVVNHFDTNISTNDTSSFSNNTNSTFIFNSGNQKTHTHFRLNICFGIVGCLAAFIAGIVIGRYIVPQNHTQSQTAFTTHAISTSQNDAEHIDNDPKSESAEVGEIISNNQVNIDADFSFMFCDANIFHDYLPSGTYKCGVDMDPGKYVIFAYVGDTNYSVYNELDGSPIEYNSGIMMYVELDKDQYIEIGYGGLMFSPDNLDYNSLKQYGIFLVGTDIPSGEYKISAITDEYQSSLDSITGNISAYSIYDDIKSNPIQSEYIFSDSYIELTDGQYIAVCNLQFTKVE